MNINLSLSALIPGRNQNLFGPRVHRHAKNWAHQALAIRPQPAFVHPQIINPRPMKCVAHVNSAPFRVAHQHNNDFFLFAKISALALFIMSMLSFSRKVPPRVIHRHETLPVEVFVKKDRAVNNYYQINNYGQPVNGQPALKVYPEGWPPGYGAKNYPQGWPPGY